MMDPIVAKAIRYLEEDICLACEQPVKIKRQVGRSVYGDCGHRLYRGRLNAEEVVNKGRTKHYNR